MSGEGDSGSVGGKIKCCVCVLIGEVRDGSYWNNFPFQAANVQQTLKDIKASNQQAQFLGNKVEVAITNAVEKNKTLLRVGLHFEFGDCRSVSKCMCGGK